MTGAEIVAIVGGVIWIVERVFSWKHKKTRSKQVKKLVELVENGNGKPPAFEK